MPIPPADLARIDQWVAAENRNIGEHINEVRIDRVVARNTVTILESRPPWDSDVTDEWVQQEVARLRFERSRGWTLYWPDRNSEFHEYDGLTSTMRVQTLLDEIKADPACIFWG